MPLGTPRQISQRHDEGRGRRKQALPQHVDTNRVGFCEGETVALIVGNGLVTPIDVDLGGNSHAAFPSNGLNEERSEAGERASNSRLLSEFGTRLVFRANP
jgi:hypothetical protein